MKTWIHEAGQCFAVLSYDFSSLLYTTHIFHYQSSIQIYKVDKSCSGEKKIIKQHFSW